jgi:catechol 2,3-dioxygenase-like lactoylglutathione lyase family enzyme
VSPAPRLRWCFHGTAVVRRYDAALAWLERLCGCRALEYSDHPDPLVARKGGVCWIGDAGLELMEPTLPEGPPARFLARCGPGMYGVALQVEDLGQAALHLRARGAALVGDPARGYAFTHPRDTAGISLEWADKPFSFDPRFGGELPPRRCAPLLPVPRVAFFGALVEDPAAAGARLAELLGAPPLFEEPGASGGVPAAGFSLGDGLLLLYRLPTDQAELARLWGPLPRRPRVHLMALRVQDLGQAQRLLAREGVRVLRGQADSGELVSHPDDTQGIALAWTDRDLPQDPRGPLAGA